MKKITSILLLLVVLLASSGAASADDGIYQGNDISTINENGNTVSYNTLCVDHDRPVSANEKISTKPVIVTRDGVIDNVVNKWYRNISKNATEWDALQEETWKMSENTSRPYVEVPDFYKVNKTYDSNKVITIEEKDGYNWTVTRWTSYIDEFTFRMTGDGWGIGQQDLLLFIVNSFDFENANFVQIPAIVPPKETPITPPIVTPEELQNTTTDDTPNPPKVVNPESPVDDDNGTVDDIDNPINPQNGTNNTNNPNGVPPSAPGPGGDNTASPDGTLDTANAHAGTAMKKTGLPVLPALLVLIASLSGIGLGLRRKD